MAKVDIGICIYDISGPEESEAQAALEKGIQKLNSSHLGCENYYWKLADLRDDIEQEFGVTIKNI